MIYSQAQRMNTDGERQIQHQDFFLLPLIAAQDTTNPCPAIPFCLWGSLFGLVGFLCIYIKSTMPKVQIRNVCDASAMLS